MKKFRRPKIKKKKWASEAGAKKESKQIAKNTLKPYKAKRGPYKTK